MSEKQKRIQALRKHLLILNDTMNQLSEMSKRIPPEDKERMKGICDAQQKNIKNALEILDELSELEKE